MLVIINYSLFFISIDLKLIFVNIVYFCKYMNLNVKEIYEVLDIVVLFIIELNMESICLIIFV